MLRLATVNTLIDKAIDYAKSLFDNISGDHTSRNSIVLRLRSQSVTKKIAILGFQHNPVALQPLACPHLFCKHHFDAFWLNCFTKCVAMLLCLRK